MPAVTASLGISSFSSGVITKVSTSRKVETKVLKDFSGAFSTAAKFDPTSEFSVDGQADYPSITLGVASTNIPSTISGGVIVINSLSKTESAEDFQKWSYKGTHYPNAS
jgi:hypothetical protein